MTNDSIGDYYRQHHSTPTTREIADAMGISPASGYNYLVEMSRRGMLSYEDGVIADLPKINKTQTGYFSAPLVGSIRCGDPENQEEQVEMYAILTSGEIRPTNVVPVLAPGKNGEKATFPMKWGFQIPGRSLIVNARTETASQKPTFRESWEKRRCVIPASWYYEWEHLEDNYGQKKTGAKYMIQPKGSPMTWLCGLYRIEDGFPVFTVLTREPTEELRRIHDRMPLILPKDRIDDWIKPDTRPEDLLPYALTDMLAEKTG